MNSVKPPRKSSFGPYRSPSRPAVISSTAYTSTYALRIHRISSSDALRLVLMSGTAMFTIVVSSRIMKKPMQRMLSTSHGLRGRVVPESPATVGALVPVPLAMTTSGQGVDKS